MTEPTRTVASDSSGDLFDGRYRLGRLLGRGGRARVYEAVDTALGRTLAIKVIDGDGADPSDVARVRSEIRLLASLSHPSLVTLYDARLDATPAYLAMELIAGPTLTDLIARGRLTGPETARVGREVAEAFAVIHGRRIVHRDVKPSNILMRPAAHAGDSPRATLADFGIASLVGATRVTRADTVIGTAAYLSPEQARGMPAALASDVYALGLVLLEALTGSRPFGSRTPHEALAARLVSSPEIPAHIPSAWRDVLERMTAIDPAERPDAGGVIVALRTLSDLPVPAPGEGTTSRMSAVPGSTGPTRILAAPTSGASASAGRRRRVPRRAVVVASVVAGVLAVGGITAAVAAGTGGAAEVDLPSLPQPLDQHIDDLWKEVGQ
ncbi:Protein kinase domain-containing protein [Microbacterium sp. ru370.1]|uniref:serine/threonine-protein kinase n=1 Tax=unclassified Microbacterium TaxID=2609290 RepID=UPI000884EFE2|nr:MULTISPECIES: serine/threonine-protein kinase [unclassified Microbacterium]SDO55537.1 Protein kinase domain-containing protein [Microbacterium sp. ru370.1]SIT84971.1 Protein kinase domain-containing protein [Microbacterium sp. RU1D]